MLTIREMIRDIHEMSMDIGEESSKQFHEVMMGRGDPRKARAYKAASVALRAAESKLSRLE